MSYESFIAFRYLTARRRQTAVSVITAIAVGGIMLGVAALIVAQALIVGFRTEVQEKVLQGTAHINLLKEDNSGIEDYRNLVKRVSEVAGVRAASATTYTTVLINAGGRQEQAPLTLKGVDMESPHEANEVYATTIAGDPSLLASGDEAQYGSEEPIEGIIIGQPLARKMGIGINNLVTVTYLQSRLTPLGLQPRPRSTKFRVVGIFSSGFTPYDENWAYISLTAAQRLSGSGRTASLIQMKVDDIYAVKEIAEKVRRTAGPGFMTTDWEELNRPLFTAFALQNKMVIIFFVILIVFAAVNITTTLTMMVIEKHKDIAILRAQGATPRAIRNIFLLQGAIIGIIGAGMGLALGLAICWIANRYRLISIPADIYTISHITLKVRAFDCLWVPLLALAICLLATLYPSRKASRLTPVEGLRYE
ncbi:MAG: ABC transporter permease [Blastocatellia bacterium]|nr:ABC transporter permease [Blastocatellia bacterium]